ncbi:MAG: glucose-1-phosphate thymidylyltransferase [Pelagibacteraceae bacterium]|nr:glucose-1-phosphate thymidylyltransferase [Pelagibacteraceae bacterium]PPR33125.1 MAG: Glucose-1-phosphate thymidylyltransferase [Alphaproteobacteria bacterium MarineAlpha6_Bin5]|tara:strand:- start:591 stop:1466 length:876 start_codon:yes stop_codon:yes gene_type:complete
MSQYKGIVLAAGSATRLFPTTLAVNKQLLPIYDKPMIFFSLSVLMLADIRKILIIVREKDKKNFFELLGNGKDLGVDISYAIQKKPKGIADAFKIGKNFIKKDNVALVLGDNIFYGKNLSNLLFNAKKRRIGATIFSFSVKDPERFGVIEIKNKNKVLSIVEKPKKPKSNLAATGLYFYDNRVVDIVKRLKPSKRGELEITDVNTTYLKNEELFVEHLGKGFSWLDTGTSETLLDANNFISTTQKNNKKQIACLEEIALKKKWIKKRNIENRLKKLTKGSYSDYLRKLIKK